MIIINDYRIRFRNCTYWNWRTAGYAGAGEAAASEEPPSDEANAAEDVVVVDSPETDAAEEGLPSASAEDTEPTEEGESAASALPPSEKLATDSPDNDTPAADAVPVAATEEVAPAAVSFEHKVDVAAAFEAELVLDDDERDKRTIMMSKGMPTCVSTSSTFVFKIKSTTFGIILSCKYYQW